MIHVISVNRQVTVTKIALCGKLRAGKDEVAKHLSIWYGFDRFAFGDELKRIYHELNPWVPADPKPRAEYQRFGQAMRELCGDDIWIRHAERKINNAIDAEISVGKDRIGIAVTDLRQPNEYEWARANGFTIVRVTAPNELRLERARKAGDDFTEADMAHNTEQWVDKFDVDFEIVNDGTLDELWAKVDGVMEKISPAA